MKEQYKEIFLAEKNLVDYKNKLKNNIEIIKEEVEKSAGLQKAKKIAILEVYKDLLKNINEIQNKIPEIEIAYQRRIEKWN